MAAADAATASDPCALTLPCADRPGSVGAVAGVLEQDTARVDHAMAPAGLTAIGRDVESTVLARAVLRHAERRVLIDGRKTVAFR